MENVLTFNNYDSKYWDEKEIGEITTLDDMIRKLYDVFAEDTVNVEYVKAVLASYKSNPKDWKKYAKFDQHRYTRNLIDGGNGKFNLIALCWGEGHGSSIHDHRLMSIHEQQRNSITIMTCEYYAHESDAHCFVKILDGCLKETMYNWPEKEGEPMVERSSVTYEKDGVTYINDSMGLHRMENPSHSDTCVSLHLYIPAFEMCKTFDQRSGRQNKVKVTFWSKYGQRTKFSEQGCESNGSQLACYHQAENN
ncbi:DgyrCDS13389 [Dimorphilus gyrociliatus]|uniref:Cysteine dioxygenase n=1 Tax=Dimorphilus gyrociliatus TaxID=2664684 RepID=A0A7I8WAM0_9ANNE|nr:DgyrCDS13389 [Dimorphilus gyrociliatus]